MRLHAQIADSLLFVLECSDPLAKSLFLFLLLSSLSPCLLRPLLTLLQIPFRRFFSRDRACLCLLGCRRLSHNLSIQLASALSRHGMSLLAAPWAQKKDHCRRAWLAARINASETHKHHRARMHTHVCGHVTRKKGNVQTCTCTPPGEQLMQAFSSPPGRPCSPPPLRRSSLRP